MSLLQKRPIRETIFCKDFYLENTNTLRHTATHYNTILHEICISVGKLGTRCNALQHTATHCNTILYEICIYVGELGVHSVEGKNAALALRSLKEVLAQARGVCVCMGMGVCVCMGMCMYACNTPQKRNGR